MDAITKSKLQMFGAYCGWIYGILIFSGWVIAGFFPPLSPSLSADRIAAIYQSHPTQIRIGMIILSASCLAAMPFSAVLAQYVARVERGAGLLTYSMVMGGAAFAIITFYPPMAFLTAAFRPERGAELIRLMNDFAFLLLIPGGMIFLIVPLIIVVAAWCDNSAEPVFPRWCGYANAFLIMDLVVGMLAFFFHRGVFAWNGLFGIYLPGAVYIGIFTALNTHVLRRAILRDRARMLQGAVEVESVA